MDWLGYTISVPQMKVEIPGEKLQDLLHECTAWLAKTRANKIMIQSLVGRLIYVANVIFPARKFTGRILATLRAMKDGDLVTLSVPFQADVRWFVEYASLSNGLYLLTPTRPCFEIFCDSSLYGGGGVSGNYCYSWIYTPSHMRKYKDIHHLEAINIIVAYQTLAPLYNQSPADVVIKTDNIASSFALSTGKTKDTVLGACARQIWLFAASNCHEIYIEHIPGESIPLADALSRMSRDASKAQSVNDAVNVLNLVVLPPVLNNYVFFDNSL